MQSYLIIGGTKAERQKKAEEIVQNYKIAPFDQITLGDENRQSIGISQVRHLQHQLSLKP